MSTPANEFSEFASAFLNTASERHLTLTVEQRRRAVFGLALLRHWWQPGIDPARRIRAAEELAVKLTKAMGADE